MQCDNAVLATRVGQCVSCRGVVLGVGVAIYPIVTASADVLLVDARRGFARGTCHC